ncbi:MAG: ribbon-helix-helix protein, CopG family [Pseudonocardiaceae bacterium]
MSMVRKQMYIDEELNDGLRHLAARTGRSEAEHVREALRQYLQPAHHADTGDSDPLLELIGLVDDAAGPADVALQHDDYLYGAGRSA